MKSLILSAAAVLVASYSGAQVLGTGTLVDQFSDGSRSLFPGTTVYANPPYTDITGSIEYKPTFENNNANETKVWNLTQTITTDDGSGGTTPGVPSNASDPFSASPTMGILISDGGGGDNLEFGTTTSLNYTLKAAVYCAPRDAGLGWERTYIVIRCPASPETTGRNVDALGGYSLNYESDTGKVQAVKWNVKYPTLLSGAEAEIRTGEFRQVFGETAVSAGWQILEITAVDDRIFFEVNGVKLADVNDSQFASGLASLSYREVFPSNANEHGARVDYMTCTAPKSLPAPPTAASDWALYQ